MLDCWNEEQINQMEKEYFSNKGITITKFTFALANIVKIAIILALSISFTMFFITLSG
jgi:hypothetical protein